MQALKTNKKNFGERHLKTAENYLVLGISTQNEEEHSYAVTYLEKALAIGQALTEEYSIFNTNCRQSLLISYASLGETSKAEKLLKQIRPFMAKEDYEIFALLVEVSKMKE